MHDAGMSIRAIAELYNISKTTIHRIIGEYEDHGIINAWPRSGRPSVFDDRDKQHLVQVIKKDHTAPLNQITSEIQAITQKSISTSTVRRSLHMEGYYGHVGLRKLFVSNVNCQKHLNWCQERLSWNDEWNNIIWSDESRYELFGSKHCQWVWCRPEQRLDKDYLLPTFKSSQKSVMI